MNEYGAQVRGQNPDAYMRTTQENAPATISPFARVGTAMSRAQALAQRVCNLADRLVGPLPPSNEAYGAAEGSDGSIFSDMHLGASFTDDCVNAANQALDRIESALP